MIGTNAYQSGNKPSEEVVVLTRTELFSVKTTMFFYGVLAAIAAFWLILLILAMVL